MTVSSAARTGVPRSGSGASERPAPVQSRGQGAGSGIRTPSVLSAPCPDPRFRRRPCRERARSPEALPDGPAPPGSAGRLRKAGADGAEDRTTCRPPPIPAETGRQCSRPSLRFRGTTGQSRPRTPHRRQGPSALRMVSAANRRHMRPAHAGITGPGLRKTGPTAGHPRIPAGNAGGTAPLLRETGIIDDRHTVPAAGQCLYPAGPA